jgi:hypothetical protein
MPMLTAWLLQNFEFRAPHHAHWLVSSVALLALQLAVFLLVAAATRDRSVRRAAGVPLVLLALAHGTVAVLAVVATRQAPSRGLLSVDCIWFNALVALLYLLPLPLAWSSSLR